MAHPCASCGSECYCCGDIDDCVVSKTPDSCHSCGCENDDDFSYDDDEDMEPIGCECIGCTKGFDDPGDCPICGNPLEPYG